MYFPSFFNGDTKHDILKVKGDSAYDFFSENSKVIFANFRGAIACPVNIGMQYNNWHPQHLLHKYKKNKQESEIVHSII